MAQRELPLYRKIANSLVEAITSAKYPVGSNLPTEHELSAKLKVSRATIVAALDELERLGLIYRRPRLGTQVASRFPVMNHVEEGSVLHDWARYGVKYFFEVLNKDYVSLPREAGADPARARKWLKLSGRRVRPRSNRPICAVDVYVHPDYVAIEPDVPRRPPRNLLANRGALRPPGCGSRAGIACDSNRKWAGQASRRRARQLCA